MNGGKTLDRIEMVLRDRQSAPLSIFIDIADNSLSGKWLRALNHLLQNNFHLEKNFCFMGFPDSDRDGVFICEQINRSIRAINQADIGYRIDDEFSLDNTISDDPRYGRACGRNIIQDRLNWLHRYFEDLQGVSGRPSKFYLGADDETRWHIRQLNLLCHEFESWALSYRKQREAPDWICPSQLMCWLEAPRFVLEPEDFELFGIDTLNRDTGAVYVGVNKAVGKHHWEVFCDEGRNVAELVSTTMRGQTEAAGDFDIEWGRNPQKFEWRQTQVQNFRSWLSHNGFDPDAPELTIGHPKIGQVDLEASFGTQDHATMVKMLANYTDVFAIRTNDASAEYPYHWSDRDYQHRQITEIALRRQK
jgi:hypothetical protein